MSVRLPHQGHPTWFITFTCFDWIPLFEITKSYDLIYQWFNHLHKKKKADIIAYVIMPNHVHAILHLKDTNPNLNPIVANAKRLAAYEIISRLEEQKNSVILNRLSENVMPADSGKGQKHRAFEPSFDAKALVTEELFFQKLNYIHHNPVRGKWKLAEDYRDYEHSSASYYELGVAKHFEPRHYRDI